jgi:alpha-beta hydrolase superfamily lysophospholipase
MNPTTLTTADGLHLHLHHGPAGVSGRGTVLIVHGLGEHVGRYTELAADLNSWGWHVAAMDHRGHGRSQGLRGCVRREDDLLNDLALAIDAVRATRTGPLVLLGHSMGGVAAARFVAAGLPESGPRPAWWREIDALVLSSPALAIDTTWYQRVSLAVFGRLTPNLAVNNGLQRKWISRDANVVAAYKADPLVHDRISPKLGGFILHSGQAVRRVAAHWRVPTLLLYAGSDLCVAPRGSREFAAAAPPAVVRAQEFPALFHEIFNEPERGDVLAVLRPWLAGVRQAA